MAIRLPTREWAKTVKGLISSNTVGITKAFAIIDNVLWYGGTINATSGFDTLTGISAGDGIEVADINIRSLLNITSGVGAYTHTDLGVDHNNYVWLNGAVATGRPNFIVVDTINRSIVTSIGVFSSGSYSIPTIAVDKTNKLMWVPRNATTLDAFSSVTYAVSHSITTASTTDRHFVINEDRDEIWIVDGSANTLKVYRSSTGVFLRDVSGINTTGSGVNLISIPEKNIILFSSSSITQVFSTITYTLLGTINAPGADSFNLLYYSPNTNEIYGYYFEDSTGLEKVGFYDLETFTLNHKETVTTGPSGLSESGITGIDGSIYFGSDNTSGTGIINKLVFSVLESSSDTGDSGIFTDIPDIFNRELIFDLDLGAFYVHDIGHTGYPAPVDYVQLPGFATSTQDETIMAGNDVVLVTSGDTVVIDGLITTDRTTEPREENFKYVTLSSTNFTLAEYKDFSFKDFVSFDGTGKFFDSYIVTGYDFSQDMMRKKRTIYMLVYNERTETIYTLDEGGNVVLARQSGCLIQPQWEWNSSAAQGRWGRSFQAYRLLRNLPTSPSSGDELDYGERVIITKNKLRGNGRSLSILIRSEDGKDMKLLGWALDVTRQDFV